MILAALAKVARNRVRQGLAELRVCAAPVTRHRSSPHLRARGPSAHPPSRKRRNPGDDRGAGSRRRARASAGESHLVLVTGVPGAGKTLVGLQFVYESHFGETERPAKAVFLSGNAPLVKVLQYTLKSRVFVQDVLGFLRTYGGSRGALPREHIWVFDEAQRAFDAEMAMEKRGEPISEPEDFLRLGERLDSWALMVGLIGEGQEINRGEEAGIAQWNDALASWTSRGRCTARRRSPPVFTNASRDHYRGRLSLDMTLRSHRAEEIHKWVALLLAGDLGRVQAAGRTAAHRRDSRCT